MTLNDEYNQQASQERTYQEYVASKSKEKISQMEQYYDQMISKAQNEITCILILNQFPAYTQYRELIVFLDLIKLAKIKFQVRIYNFALLI